MEMSSEKHVVEAKINPQAVADYYYNSDVSGKSRAVKDVQMKAKQHLAAMGWTFFYILKKGDKRELRYCPPNSKKKYISLRMACKGYLDSNSQFKKIGDSVLGSQSAERTDDVLESQIGKRTDGGLELQSGKNVLEGDVLREANVDVSSNKKKRLSFVDVYGKRMLACMKGKKEVGGEDDVLEQDTLSEQENFSEFSAEVDSETLNDDTESSFTESGNKSGRKGSELAHQDKKRKIGVKGRSGGKLAIFLKHQVIKPFAKVYYRNKRDDTVMGEGRVTTEGVDCSCCRSVFTLTGFEAHVGSTYHRPAENTFVEDGRSLMQIEQEMGAVDKQVKGIKKNVKASKNASVSGTVQEKSHDDFCLVCRGIGEFILCDQCTSAFHPHCIALSKIPAGELWYCTTCCCKICGQKCPSDDSETTNTCDQCEQQYHVKCLGDHCVADLERKKWYCSEKCKDVSSGLGELLGKSFVVGQSNLSWTLLKNDENNVIDLKTTRKLKRALAVMHKCFGFVKEPWTGRDVAKDLIFSRPSEVKRLDYRGFYTVILEKKAAVVTVATVRIFGNKVAELPFVATQSKYRKLGMCKTLMGVLEEKLVNLGIEKLVLPAIPSLVAAWTGPSFGFSEMTPDDRSKLINYTLLGFPDSVMCQKLLVGSG